MPRELPEGLRGVKVPALVKVELRNVGDRTASETVVHLIAPRELAFGLLWCGPSGEELPPVSHPADTHKKLFDDRGVAWPGHYVSKTFPRVNRRSVYTLFAYFEIPWPPPYGVRALPGGPLWVQGEAFELEGVTVPLRVTGQADELPDDVEEAVEDLRFSVSRSPRDALRS